MTIVMAAATSAAATTMTRARASTRLLKYLLCFLNRDRPPCLGKGSLELSKVDVAVAIGIKLLEYRGDLLVA